MDRLYDIKHMDAEELKTKLRRQINDEWFYVALLDCFRTVLEPYAGKTVDRRISEKLRAAIASSKDVDMYGKRAGVSVNSLRTWYTPDGDRFRLEAMWEWHGVDKGTYTSYDRGDLCASYLPRAMTEAKCTDFFERMGFHARAIPALQRLLSLTDHVVATYNSMLGSLYEFHEAYIDDDLPGEIRRLFPLAGHKL